MTAETKRMRGIVAAFQKYVSTYSDQPYYETYLDKTFLDDMLYGVGIAFDREEYSTALGYEKFKARLREHLRLTDQPTGVQS